MITFDPEQFTRYFDRLRQRTLAVADCIPEEFLEWSYQEDKWTLGDILRHLAALERWMWAENVEGRPSRYTGCGPELAQGPPGVRDYMKRMHDESMAIFNVLTPEDMERPCMTPAGSELPTWKWLRAMCEHEIHHRGQLYTYLALLRVEAPPLFGLTSEQVVARAGQR